jgi:hypothetical protein
MMPTRTKPSLLSSLGGDTARTRKSHPATSHAAADVSQATIHQTKVRVLIVVKENGPLVGSEINDLYQFRGARSGWDRVAWDTPRKRAGELAADGYLDIIGTRPAVGNHLDESIYQLSEKGLRVVTLGLGR